MTRPALVRALRRAALALAPALLALVASSGCSKHTTGPAPVAAATRSYRMGFAGIPPRVDIGVLLAAIQMWAPRADAALMSEEVPWDSLLAGVRPDSFVVREKAPLAQYYRALGVSHLTVMVDPANGLDRGAEAEALTRAGRSITEPAVQRLYRDYCVAMDTLCRPDEIGFVLETNLIRAAAPPALYGAIRQAASDAAADVRAVDPTVRLMVSVQVEQAWGRFIGGNVYEGVAQDFTDFPFLQVLGLSSYPYLVGWATPEEIPIDYYSRLVSGRSVPVMVTEGGWSSRTVNATPTSAELQRRYIVRHAQLLDHANASGWYQLTFTDLELSSGGWPAGLWPFAYHGLVDSALTPKAALAPWDSVFARPRR